MGRGRIPMMLAAGVLLLSAGAQADWRDLLKGATDRLTGGDSGSEVAGLTSAEMTAGLKEALAIGTERAVQGLSRPGGYLQDSSVRIPLPGALQKTENALRFMGQGDKVDAFVTTLNRAAEEAVPQASKIVGDTVRKMTIKDAQQILKGPDDAATTYFREKTTDDLTAAMRPIVERATDSAGVTRAYKSMLDRAGPIADIGGTSLDLDKYVTEKTLDGLFLKLAAEEKAIRTDPVARSTELLKKVFGAVKP